MRTFFALAALAANAATILIVVFAIVGRFRGTNPFEVLKGSTMWLAAGVAVIATLGSLYLSEIAHLIPCRFCWFQRIAMYPLAVILPIAAFRKDAQARLYVVVLSAIGAGLAVYHRLIQAFPNLEAGSCAAVGPSCSAPLISMFNGIVTIPYMAMSAFLLILALMYVDRINSARSVPTLSPSDEPTDAPAT
jgi:disulfide bond formation protein DsbB